MYASDRLQRDKEVAIKAIINSNNLVDRVFDFINTKIPYFRNYIIREYNYINVTDNYIFNDYRDLSDLILDKINKYSNLEIFKPKISKQLKFIDGRKTIVRNNNIVEVYNIIRSRWNYIDNKFITKNI
jgi:hypothetical protein